MKAGTISLGDRICVDITGLDKTYKVIGLSFSDRMDGEIVKVYVDEDLYGKRDGEQTLSDYICYLYDNPPKWDGRWERRFQGFREFGVVDPDNIIMPGEECHPEPTAVAKKTSKRSGGGFEWL